RNERRNPSRSTNRSVAAKKLDARIAARTKERATRIAAPPPTYEISLKNVGKPGLGDALKDPKPLAKAAVEFSSIDGDQKSDGDRAEEIIRREAENILVDYIKLSLDSQNGIIVKR